MLVYCRPPHMYMPLAITIVAAQIKAHVFCMHVQCSGLEEFQKHRTKVVLCFLSSWFLEEFQKHRTRKAQNSKSAELENPRTRKTKNSKTPGLEKPRTRKAQNSKTTGLEKPRTRKANLVLGFSSSWPRTRKTKNFGVEL